MIDLLEELKNNEYPGRGIVCGRTPDGKKAVIAYFIMGRSQNSRNRVFEETKDGIRTKAFDESKMEDPSLIIYSPVRVYGDTTIVTNGDQTDTVYEGLTKGVSFSDSLKTREFEPDKPNYTPRISAALTIKGGDYSLLMSILKSDENRADSCLRFTFDYENPIAGEGRFLHTYMGDGDPLPSFSGEPKLCKVFTDDIDEFSGKVWDSLNSDNKVSLFVRFIDISENTSTTRIFNKNNE